MNDTTTDYDYLIKFLALGWFQPNKREKIYNQIKSNFNLIVQAILVLAKPVSSTNTPTAYSTPSSYLQLASISGKSVLYV